MAENPFESFFSGLQGGFAAGQERRSLLDRADPNAPSVGATFLRGLRLADTMPRTAQEETARMSVEANIALGHLNARLRETSLRNQQAQDLLSHGIRLREQEQDFQDAELLANSSIELTDMLRRRQVADLETANPPQGLSAKGLSSWMDIKKDLMDSFVAKEAGEYMRLQETVRAMGVDPVGKTSQELRTERDRLLGIQASQQAQGLIQGGASSATIQLPGGGSVTARALSPGSGSSGSSSTKAEGLTSGQTQTRFLDNLPRINELKIQESLPGGLDETEQAELNALLDEQDTLADHARRNFPSMILPGVEGASAFGGGDAGGPRSSRMQLQQVADTIVADAIRIAERNSLR